MRQKVAYYCALLGHSLQPTLQRPCYQESLGASGAIAQKLIWRIHYLYLAIHVEARDIVLLHTKLKHLQPTA